MSLKDAINKGEFVFRFSGLNRLAQPAKTDVIMERTVAMPQTHTNTDKVDGVNIHEMTEKLRTEEIEVKPLKTSPTKPMRRKADVEARDDEKRHQVRQRKEKPAPAQILIKDLSTEAKPTKASRKKKTQDSVKEIIGSA